MIKNSAIGIYSVVVLVLPFIIWGKQTGDLSFYFSDMAPDGQLLYVLSKLSGLCALALLMLQVSLAIADKAGIWAISWTGKTHRVAGVSVVILVLAHLFLFFTAVTIRQGYPAWGMFVPNFTDYYHTRLTLGLLGLWILFGVLIAGVCRLRKRCNKIHFLHKGYVFSALLAYIHALSVGTEAQSLYGMAYYVFLAAVSLCAIAVWLFRSPVKRASEESV